MTNTLITLFTLLWALPGLISMYSGRLNPLDPILLLLLTLILSIPGIIAYYKYSMTLYILADNPKITARDAIRKSVEMMNGYKLNLFRLHLSFTGWIFLFLIIPLCIFLFYAAFFSLISISFITFGTLDLIGLFTDSDNIDSILLILPKLKNLASILSLGSLWLFPYMKVSEAYFYQNLKRTHDIDDSDIDSNIDSNNDNDFNNNETKYITFDI